MSARNTELVAPVSCVSSARRSSKRWSQPHERRIRRTMSHRHYCDYAGHDWQCAGDCECICGLPMEGNDHSECPVELRACPEHSAAQQLSHAEATSSESPTLRSPRSGRSGPLANADALKPNPARPLAGASLATTEM